MATLFVFAGVEKIFKYGDVTRYCRVAALILAIWTFVLTLVFHQFWKVPENIWQLMVDNFFHSFVMVGGLMYVVVFGAGARPDPGQPISAVE